MEKICFETTKFLNCTPWSSLKRLFSSRTWMKVQWKELSKVCLNLSRFEIKKSSAMRICWLKLNCQEQKEQKYTKKKGKKLHWPLMAPKPLWTCIHRPWTSSIWGLHYQKFLYFKIESLEIEKTAVLGWRKSVLKYKKRLDKNQTYWVWKL